MSEPEQPPADAPAPASPEAPPPEEKTAPHRLRDLADKAAKKRRRTTAAELLVRRPKSAEVRVPLDRSETIIGRDQRCDIVLTEPKASRRHARIQRGEGGYFEIIDLGSRNGIVVDEERVERMTLLDGDRFVIGDTEFTIIVGPLPGVEP
ncbi:MAG: FHA domain-containing protein [Deltaproteobacteria bacterium]|nr:FHA domain-containing protein [Deltaproteobacteria bacterium]